MSIGVEPEQLAAVEAAVGAPQRRTVRSSITSSSWWQPVVVFFVLIGIWYLISLYYAGQGLTYFFPYPHQVLYAMVAEPQATSIIYPDLFNSIQVAVTGLAIAVVIGVVWAVLMSQARWAERALFPYAVILQCIPILAITPILGVLFGTNFLSRVVVTVLISIFPMVSNTLFGLQAADTGQRELFQLQGASRWTRLIKLQFPAALPSIFVGLRTSAGLSVVGAIVGDQLFQRGAPGLGVAIQVFVLRIQGQEGFAAIAVAALFGVAVFVIFGFLRRLAVGKWFDAR